MIERLATYRVQLHGGFPFDAAAETVAYLAGLGVSHLYCSPSLQAVPGSLHGYDVVDPTRLSEDLGGQAGWGRLKAALRGAGMGALLDIVPNHMAANAANPWWWDVLEDGALSPYAAHFDVDWESPLDPATRGRVLLPVLGDDLARVVDRGELRLERRDDGRVVARYHDQVAPLAAGSLVEVLHGAARRSGSAVLAAAAHAAARLRDVAGGDAEARALQRRAMWEEICRACAEDESAAAALDDALETVNQAPEELLSLLDAQCHRLAFWRLALGALNYRRFFDITSLIALRAERAETFTATHAAALALLHRGDVDGLRIDHVDGLRDPAAYLRRLREQAGPDGWLVVEKILGDDEAPPRDWPVQGTTGYEFAALSTRLLTDPAGEAALRALHAELGGAVDLEAESRRAKLLVMETTLAGDVERLALLLREVAAPRLGGGERTVAEARDVVAELIAAMRVYRTYAAPGADAAEPGVQRLQAARERVVAMRPDIDRELLDLLCTLVAQASARDGDEAATELVLRLQQVGSAVMAKGMEDTTFYRVVPLSALDEVGCAPQPFSVSLRSFHDHCERVQRESPYALLATTTHDTKRSEDVRARLALLSEMPGAWAERVRAWHGRNQRYRRGDWPDGTMENLLYQSMVGAWPVSHQRIAQYMEKAAREAKLHTSWIDPVPDYEAALQGFVSALYEDSAFLAELEEVVAVLRRPGWVNSLAATLLKLAAPGVPDIYQGCELWTYTLVDPDNRRPVDYGQRRALLRRCAEVSAAQAWSAEAESGLPKLLLTRRALALRARHAEHFGCRGAYTPLHAEGARAQHVVAFARGADPGVVAVAPRWPLRLGGDWGDTTLALPDGDWHDQLTGAAHRGGTPLGLAQLLADFPVALLARHPFAEEKA